MGNGYREAVDSILAEEGLRRETVMNAFSPFPASFDGFYGEVLADRPHRDQEIGADTAYGPNTFHAAVQGEPLNCLGRALSGLLVGTEQYGRDLVPVVEYMGGMDPETGMMEERRSHIFLIDRTEPGEPRIYGENKGLTEHRTGDAEVLNGQELYGLYCMAEAANVFDPDAADRGGARAYQQKITELGVTETSEYLEQLGNSINNNF